MRTLSIALCLLVTPALADVAGVASVIDGDTIEVHGQRIREVVGVAPGGHGPKPPPAGAPVKASPTPSASTGARVTRGGARGR